MVSEANPRGNRGKRDNRILKKELEGKKGEDPPEEKNTKEELASKRERGRGRAYKRLE